MKTKSFSFFLMLLFLVSTFCAQAQNNPLTGEWKLNKEKTVLPDSQIFLSKINIQVKGDSLFTTRIYEDTNGQEYPFDENLSLNGKESKIFIYNMPRTAKATLSKADGSIILTSTTTFNNNGQDVDMVAEETWKVEQESKQLSITSKDTIPGRNYTVTSFFDGVK